MIFNFADFDGDNVLSPFFVCMSVFVPKTGIFVCGFLRSSGNW